jgi:hypothetical protein
MNNKMDVIHNTLNKFIEKVFKFNNVFIVFNILIIIGAVVCFIYGQFDFKNKFVQNGSFIGGHLVQLSFPLLLFGLLGIYGIVTQNRVALMVYFGITLSSIFIRNINNGLAGLHGFYLIMIKGEVFGGLFLFFELFALLLSCASLILVNSYEVN